MPKNIWAFALFCCAMQGLSAQIAFEKGYFINNSGEKIECLIKNMGWKNNPDSFQFKLEKDVNVQEANIYNVKEFKTEKSSRFVRKTVEINKSSSKTTELERDRKVSFVIEQLFLKELVDGSAQLYSFEDKSLVRFFYTMPNMEPMQLVYKKFLKENMQIGENNEYRQQLLNSLDCADITISKIKRLRYKKESLTNIFNVYNQCVDPTFEIQKTEDSNYKFLLTANLGVNLASLSITNGPFAQRSTDFGSNISLRVGVELESFLPFNKNKWSLFIAPTYQNFKKEGLTNISLLFNNPIKANVNYQSIELPLGFRHYFYLNNANGLFLDAAFVFDLDFNSKITFDNDSQLEIDAPGIWRLGAGYKIKDKIKLQLRYFTPRNLLNRYQSWDSDYNVYSIILGYSFK
jgi:hypothetical protein